MASERLKIVIVGLGYVGVTAAACLAHQGHQVVGVDVNSQKVRTLNEGLSPVVEDGVNEMLEEAVASGTLRAELELPSMRDVDLVIVCVGTPSAPDGSHNMGFIAESTRQIALAVAASAVSPVTVAYRSTFRPGTMEELVSPIFSEMLGENSDLIELVYNPEFLRESTAVADYFNPAKIVVGTADGQPSGVMDQLYAGINSPKFNTGFREAEITKFVDNSWHAVKVAFANEVGRVAAAYGIDSDVVHQIFIADTKLNVSPYYLRPGGAFGGSCLPKDVRAMQFIAAEAGADVELIGSLLRSNEAHKKFQLDRVMRQVRAGARVLVIGLAFKERTDDMRESPNVDLVAELIRANLVVRVYDPAVHTSALIGQNLGHVMTEIPRLREILITEEELRHETFDLVVKNSSAAEELVIEANEVVDLRRISTQRHGDDGLVRSLQAEGS